jgi:hypothetical protein
MLRLVFALALLGQPQPQPAYPAGIEVHRSECASGD